MMLLGIVFSCPPPMCMHSVAGSVLVQVINGYLLAE